MQEALTVIVLAAIAVGISILTISGIKIFNCCSTESGNEISIVELPSHEWKSGDRKAQNTAQVIKILYWSNRIT